MKHFASTVRLHSVVNPRNHQRKCIPMRRVISSAMCTVAIAVVVGLLPGPSAVQANAASAAAPLCIIDGANELVCPPIFSQPDLLNPAELETATPEQADALRAFQDQALNNLLTNHQLPPSELPELKTYARDEAHAELWALIVQAIRLPAASRTPRQQAIADWMNDKLVQQRLRPAKRAAREYAKFAGKNLLVFDDIIGGATEERAQNVPVGPSGAL